MGSLFGGWGAVVIQLVDFLFKGVNFYLASEQGQKEFDDIVQAWESRANTDDGGSVEYTASNADGSVSKGSPERPNFKSVSVAYPGGKPQS